jgi:hypothetical protein
MSTSSAEPSSIAGLSREYRHHPKLVTPGETLALPAITLKWYDLARAKQPVPDSIARMARSHLVRDAARPTFEPRGLGYAILHRCGESFYFLIVCVWNQNNEVWESVHYKDGDAMADFAPFPRPGPHLPTFCVWELGPVWHEQQAWVRFLNSPRDASAGRAWLDDRLSGSV